jgi:co-chaperonin GroES (HSP10)
MPLNREQIKHAPVSKEVWRDNKTQYGGLWFDPRKIRPLADHVLIELDPEISQSKIIATPEIARNKDIGTRIGTVLRVGPGKWKEKSGLSWELTKQVFKPTTLKPGDRVIIGHYSDWESWHCDPENRDANIVLCQEADVRLYDEELHDALCVEE